MTSIPMHIIEPLVDCSPGLQDRPRLRQQAEEKDYLFLPALLPVQEVLSGPAGGITGGPAARIVERKY